MVLPEQVRSKALTSARATVVDKEKDRQETEVVQIWDKGANLSCYVIVARSCCGHTGNTKRLLFDYNLELELGAA